MREPLQKQNRKKLFQVWLAHISGSFMLSCLCFYLFYWSLDVVGCLLFAVDIKGPQGCLAESDCIYACSVSLPFSVFFISLVSIWCFGPSLNVILKDHVITYFLLHPYFAHWSSWNGAGFNSVIFSCICPVFLHFHLSLSSLFSLPWISSSAHSISSILSSLSSNSILILF